MMRNGWVRWAGWGLACLAVVGLVGCQGREEPTTPSPTRSASVSLSPSASPSGSVDEQALIDEAVAVVEQYYVLGSEVENNGGEGWEVLIPLLTPEAADAARAHFETLRENGWHTEGTLSCRVSKTQASNPVLRRSRSPIASTRPGWSPSTRPTPQSRSPCQRHSPPTLT